MNKKLLVLSLAAILAAPAAFAATGSDSQTVTVTVPEVALLNIVNDSANLSLSDTGMTAGATFSPATAKTDYKISANTESGSSKKRKIDVSVAGSIPTGGTLTITPLATGMTGAVAHTLTLTGTDPTDDLITNIGNVAATVTDGIAYSFGPTTLGGMIGYTASPETITVTYTLSTDS